MGSVSISLCQLTLVGVRQSWRNLLDGHCGIKSLADRGTAFQKLQCRGAGLVPEGPYEENRWNARDWLSRDVPAPDQAYN